MSSSSPPTSSGLGRPTPRYRHKCRIRNKRSSASAIINIPPTVCFNHPRMLRRLRPAHRQRRICDCCDTSNPLPGSCRVRRCAGLDRLRSKLKRTSMTCRKGRRQSPNPRFVASLIDPPPPLLRPWPNEYPCPPPAPPYAGGAAPPLPMPPPPPLARWVLSWSCSVINCMTLNCANARALSASFNPSVRRSRSLGREREGKGGKERERREGVSVT